MINFKQPSAKITKLKTKITQLKQEKEQLRLFLHELIEAYYRTVNQEESEVTDCCSCPKIKGEKDE